MFPYFSIHVCVFHSSHSAKEPADSPGVTLQTQQALHAVPLQTPQPTAPSARQEGRKRPSTQKRDSRSAQSCGRGSGCPKRNCTWKHRAGSPAPQEERPQTWKQGETQTMRSLNMGSITFTATFFMLKFVKWMCFSEKVQDSPEPGAAAQHPGSTGKSTKPQLCCFNR